MCACGVGVFHIPACLLFIIVPVAFLVFVLNVTTLVGKEVGRTLSDHLAAVLKSDDRSQRVFDDHLPEILVGAFAGLPVYPEPIVSITVAVCRMVRDEICACLLYIHWINRSLLDRFAIMGITAHRTRISVRKGGFDFSKALSE